jgi:putative aminopeptidase FrvX
MNLRPLFRLRLPSSSSILLFSIFAALSAAPVAAQSLQEDLATLVARPAVTGYEQALAKEIAARLKQFSPQVDNLGNVVVTLGSGSPRRLIVAPMDEPGYVVSGITEDGYLRVQRLPQAAPNAVFDLLFAAQPVVIQTRKGTWVNGVVAGLSTHLQTARRDAPRGSHPDEIYIDIGASSAAEVRQAGVDLLDPIGLDRQLYQLGLGLLTAPGIGDRFGCAALVDLLRRVDTSKVKGTLTVAFTAQQWAPSRGFDRLMQHFQADEVIHVFRMRAGLAVGRSADSPRQPIVPRRTPGSGVMTGKMRPEEPLTDLPAELKSLADQLSIPFMAEYSVPMNVVSYTRGPDVPRRFAHVGIPIAWPSTPAEMISLSDLENLTALLEAYVTGAAPTKKPSGAMAASPLAPPSPPARPKTPPAPADVLAQLVERYAMSEREAAAREAVLQLLPAWAKPETDDMGNLILRLGTRGLKSKPSKLLFVAHMDELGYLVRAISADGRLEVQSRGGGIPEFFSGHAVLVHTANGIRPGVMELPTGWDLPNFEWPRGPAAAAATAGDAPQAARSAIRVDVGARSAEEVAQLGIKVGDWITIPKKYRKLFGARANGRSFDDRVGCASLISAVWALGATPQGQAMPKNLPAVVTFVWSTQEEIGLNGAKAVADRLAAAGETPDFVFAVDTFVSSDSPLESKRFADAPIGKGFVIRAVDGSTITDRKYVDKVIALALKNQIPVQYGVTGGGNDGATFLRHGAVNIPLAWPLRYSHSPGEVIDTRDLDALAKIVAAIARAW